MAKWIGYAVSVSCGEPLGCYQGTILEADGSTITLTKAFRNGFPYPKSKVTLNASDIKDLKIIEASAEPSLQTHSTVAVTKSGKKGPRPTVCENLQANPSSSASSNNVPAKSAAAPRTSAASQMPRSKPIDIQGSRTNKNNNNNNSGSLAGSTPRSRGGGGGGGATAGGDRMRRRNEACFGLDAEGPGLEEFDFEKNLALFDKQALWDQMRNSTKPDLVRQTEGCGKFRHDENVLGGGASGAAGEPSLHVPMELRGHMDYVTDEGDVVPSVRPAVRGALWEQLAGAGLADSAELLLARAVADVALRLVGGGRRLAARNTHQVPTVVAIVGADRTGACGVSGARLLASHGVLTRVLHVGRPLGPHRPALAAALRLYRGEGGEDVAWGEAGLDGPGAPPSADLVLLAVDEHDEACPEYVSAMQWLSRCRAGYVRVEPAGGAGGAGGEGGAAPARASVWAALPGEWREALGRVYVANVAASRALRALGLRGRLPHGERAALPLHVRGRDD